MEIHKVKINCPCGITTIVPISPEMKARAEGDWNLAEQTAQEKYNDLWLWLHGASLWELIEFWFKKR